jgi:hypothetical protein
MVCRRYMSVEFIAKLNLVIEANPKEVPTEQRSRVQVSARGPAQSRERLVLPAGATEDGPLGQQDVNRGELGTNWGHR